MARRELLIEGKSSPGGRMCMPGSVKWSDEIPIVNPHQDIRLPMLGVATQFDRRDNVISCEIPDELEELYDFDVFINQTSRATSRKGGTILISGEIFALLAHRKFKDDDLRAYRKAEGV